MNENICSHINQMNKMIVYIYEPCRVGLRVTSVHCHIHLSREIYLHFTQPTFFFHSQMLPMHSQST